MSKPFSDTGASDPLRVLPAPLPPSVTQLRFPATRIGEAKITAKMQPVRRHAREVVRWVRPHLMWAWQVRRLDVQRHQDEVATPLEGESHFLERRHEPRQSRHDQTTGVEPVKIETNLAPGVSWMKSVSANRFSTCPWPRTLPRS